MEVPRRPGARPSTSLSVRPKYCLNRQTAACLLGENLGLLPLLGLSQGGGTLPTSLSAALNTRQGSSILELCRADQYPGGTIWDHLLCGFHPPPGQPPMKGWPGHPINKNYSR